MPYYLLKIAKEHIDNMLNEKDLFKYEMLWMEYLTSIDRAWNKINYLSNSFDRKNIKKIIDDVNHDRNTDELLVFPPASFGRCKISCLSTSCSV